MIRPLPGLVLLTTLFALCLSGCGSSDGPDTHGATSFEQLARNTLGSGAGVARVEALQSAVDPSESVDRLNADKWNLEINVFMTPEADLDQIGREASATRAFAKKYVGTARWSARLHVGAAATLVEDTSPVSPVQFEVFPSVVGSPAEDAASVIEAKSLPHVTTVTLVGASPSVQVAGVADLGPTLDKLSGLPLWTDGGNLWTQDGRVRLVDVPDRITHDVLTTIIEQGTKYPSGQFWVQAAAQGPRFPVLYVDHVSGTEAAHIAKIFENPRLGKANAEGFVPDFNIRVNNGGNDIAGTFGDAKS